MSAMAMSTRCAKPTLNWRGYRPGNFSSGGRQTLSSSARRRGFEAAKGPPVPFRQIQQLAAVEAHVAGDRCFAEPVQAQDRQAQSALARAALPGEPQNLAGIYGDRRIVQDRPARTVRRRDPQLEQRLAVHLLASARRPDSKYRRSTFQMSGGPTTAGDTFRNSEETAHSVFR